MLTHTIFAYKAPRETFQQQSRRFKGESGSDSHKLFIFERTVGDCKFQEGDHVLFKRQVWQVIHVQRDFDDTIVWDGLSANILTIHREGELMSVHPNRVKRNR